MKEVIDACYEALLPVLERAMLLAVEYSKACGRQAVTQKDVEYCLKFCAMHTVGNRIGSFFPDIYDDPESSDEDDIEEVDESEEQYKFTRYEGEDTNFHKINEAFDTWELWEPSAPLEVMLKDSVDKNFVY